MAVKKLPFEKFKEIYSQVPRITVEVLIKTPEGLILTKRNIKPYKGSWHIPGGTVFLGEALRNAVERVAKEEVGLDVEIEKFLGVIEYDERPTRGFGWTVGLAYLVFVVGGKIENDETSSEVKVFKEIPKDMIKEQFDFIHANLGI